jgi:hypothetical protein
MHASLTLEQAAQCGLLAAVHDFSLFETDDLPEERASLLDRCDDLLADAARHFAHVTDAAVAVVV